MSGLGADDPDGKLSALAGAARYHLEQYGEAASDYERALARNPGHQLWQEMLAQCRANAIAEVSVYVPDISFFDRDALLAEPVVHSGAMPTTPMDASRTGMLRRLRILIGNLMGSVASVLMSTLSRVVGRVAGYRDDIWTNWYRRPFVLGILTLAYMREKLNRNNLKTTYPAGSLVGFQPEGLPPPPGVVHFRTADGSWNNLADPKEGGSRHALPPQCHELCHTTGNRRHAHDAEPSGGQSYTAGQTGRDERSALPQSLGRIMDQLPEP